MALYVNGEKVESAFIEAEINRLRPSYQQAFASQPKEEQEKKLAEWARENVIEATLFQQEAKKAFPRIAPQEVENILQQLLERENESGPLHQQLRAGLEQAQRVRNEIINRLRSEKLSAKITAAVPKPSEKEIRKYHEEHLDQFTIPEMVHAAHIVRHPNDNESRDEQYKQMQTILERLNSGTSFEEIARETSDCPDQGGDLGYFARGKMVQAFEDVVFNLKPGTYSGIFETEFGWHIAKVIEKQPSIPCPLVSVREVVVRELTRQACEKAIERFLDAQKEKAHYGTVEKVD